MSRYSTTSCNPSRNAGGEATTQQVADERQAANEAEEADDAMLQDLMNKVDSSTTPGL